MLKRRWIIAFLATAIVLFEAGLSTAQDSVKDLATQANGERRLVVSFRNLERSLSEINHTMTYGIVASAGGWGVIEIVNTSDMTNSDVLQSKVEPVRAAAELANSDIQRSAFSSDFQKERARSILENIEKILTAAPKIADALSADDLTAAREIYRDNCQKPYQEALLAAQSSASELEKQLGTTLFFKLRLAK